MGVVNVTPDSFSDGGRWLDAAAALAHARDLVAAGADLVDVGGESTRPGAAPVDGREEWRRIGPVVDALADAGLVVSVDTTKADVARRALDAGARVVNDVSACRFDPDMLGLVAERGAGLVAMHMQGDPRTMQDDPRYDDVVREVGDFLVERIEAACAAGVDRAAIAVDPGLGFGKTVEHNVALLAALDGLVARVGVPLVVGASRKRFLGRVLAGVGGEPAEPPPSRRDDATLATTVWAASCGARVVRVHDVQGTVRALAVLDALARAAA
jgi:dihydropteroate synthase